MRIKSMVLCVLGMLILVGVLPAQKNLEKHIDKLLASGKYLDAYEILSDVKEDDKYFYFRKGVAAYYTLHYEEAKDMLTKAYDMGYNESNLIKYMAYTHHKLGEFQDAARAYKLLLNELEEDSELREEIILNIKKCGYGRKAVYLEQVGFAENLGEIVNTPYDEYAPVISPNFDNKYYFSSNRLGSTGGLRNKNGLKDDEYGHYSSDIYAVELVNGSWIPSTGVPPLLNSARNEELQGFSQDGRVLVFIKSGGGQDDYVVADTFSANVDDFAKPIQLPINPNLGDQDLYIFNDSTILFSSKRKGGFGGYDLYFTQRNGDWWSVPENLGPQINGPYNERSPFLSRSGNILYYSSDREDGFGGYDVYVAHYGVERGEWEEVRNAGLPISSTGDDLNFSLSSDGRSGIMASDRKESMGGMDLFIVYLKNQVLEQLAFTSLPPFVEQVEDVTGMASSEESMAEEVSVENTSQPEIYNDKIREIVIEPIYFQQDINLISGDNAKELKNILDMMIIYPELEVSLSGNTVKEGGKAYDLYFSIKRAESAAQYLIKNGVDPKRISLVGLGSNYPMVKDLNSPMSNRINKRIDIRLLNTQDSRLKVNYNNPKVAEYLQDDKYKEYQSKLSGLTYRIDVAQVMQMYDNPAIMEMDDVIVEKKGGEKEYIYKVGLFNDYFSARNMKNQIIRSGKLDLKVRPYMNGKPLNESDIESLVSAYPDLQDYINYE